MDLQWRVNTNAPFFDLTDLQVPIRRHVFRSMPLQRHHSQPNAELGGRVRTCLCLCWQNCFFFFDIPLVHASFIFLFLFSPGTFGQERPENCASGVWQQRQSSGNMRTHRRRHWWQAACQTCPPAAASHSKKHRQSLSRPLYDVVAGKKKQWAAVVAKVSGMIVPCHCLFQYCVGLF